MSTDMIPLFKVRMAATVDEAVSAVLHSGYVGQGPKVDEFERALCAWAGWPHVLAVNSGTSALQLALRLAGVGPGDEVITTPMTCTATNMPILAAGAVPVWADVDPHTGNLDPASVAARVTARTKAIIGVDWGGYPCDWRALRLVAHQNGLATIRDAAHAFGATLAAEDADFACYSFQAIKTLTTVDGGALVCRLRADHERGRLLRWYGIDRDAPRVDLRCEADIAEWGYKAHMHDVAAAIGLENLKGAAQALAAARDNARFYRNTLQHTPGLRLLAYQADRQSSYWLFSLRVADKPAFIRRLGELGVQASSVHARNDQHTAFRAFARPLPGVDEFNREQVSIPCGWWVSHADRERVALAALSALKGQGATC